MKPFFTIVIPLFNKESVVVKTLESVLNQTYSDFDVVVVDDGSTDASAEKVRSVDSEKIHLFTTKNGGPGAARNRGVEKAIELNGDNTWVLFLDADDILLPSALGCLASAISEQPSAQMIVGNFLVSNGENKRLYSSKANPEFVRNPFRAFFFRDLSSRAGSFTCQAGVLKKYPHNETYRRYEDAEMLFRMFRDLKVFQIPQVIEIYQEAFCAARSRRCMKEDFLGHISMSGVKNFWEKIVLWELYILAKNEFPSEYKSLYPGWEFKYLPIKIAYHVLFRYRLVRNNRNKWLIDDSGSAS